MSAQPERLDVSDLPDYAFGHRSTLWWGTGGFVVIEGTAFALPVFGYFYLQNKLPDWPPGGAPPNLLWGTLNTLVLLASAVPNQWAKLPPRRSSSAASGSGWWSAWPSAWSSW
jgi:cytochrome c oxidase subunit 3